MTSNILSIGQSALAAAQVGLATTGHNIANSGTAGYSRQVVTQGAVAGQNSGYGFVGKGTEVTDVRRVQNEFLSGQVLAAQIVQSSLEAYYTEIKRIDNLLADPSAGVSPALQDFFNSVQNLAAQPTDAASRQSMLSSAESLAARFNGLDGQLSQIRSGVNEQIEASVSAINAYARQIAQLNDAIEKATTAAQGKPPNDLMDQRDLLIAQLGQEVRVTVVNQGNSSNVFIGNGQPLVVGSKAFALAPTSSPTDSQRTMVAYVSKDKTSVLSESALPGGRLGGLFEFRTRTLDMTQNALGRMALALGATVNAQHRLGLTLNGAPGGDVFSLPAPKVSASRDNLSTATVAAAIADTSQLTTSDYQLQYDGSQYQLTRQSDGEVFTFAGLPQTVDGVTLSLSGTPATSDIFMIRPTVAGAGGLQVALKDPAGLAASASPGGRGDARNMAAIADLQSAMTLGGGSAHFQGAYASLVADVGNKARELEVTSAAATTYLTQANQAQQSESGVNLDEEAGNLMRYQQAYQAAGKLMQTAGQLFDILLQLGR